MGKIIDWLIGRVGDVPLAINPDTLPPQDEINEDGDENKLLAKVVFDQFTKSHDVALQANVEMSRWIGTSLLAVNAGGAVAMTQLEIDSAIKVVAGLAFGSGLILPLVGAYLSISSGWALLAKMGGQMGYWHSVMNDGFRVRETELELNALAIQGAQAQVWPKRLAFLSMIAFIAGFCTAGYGTWIK